MVPFKLFLFVCNYILVAFYVRCSIPYKKELTKVFIKFKFQTKNDFF